MDEFVPRDFEVPRRLETPQFVLEPLGPEHNDQDYDAWTSSGEHIHTTPGWQDSSWPREMTPDENRTDLQRHADDFRNRKGFTYTVLDPASREVIGCVYIYPLPDSDHDALALSWVRASHAQLDTPLWRAVSEWLASDWPFGSVKYAPRAWTPPSSREARFGSGNIPERWPTQRRSLYAYLADALTAKARGDPAPSLMGA